MFSGDLVTFISGLTAIKSAGATTLWGWNPRADAKTATISAWLVAGNIDVTHGGPVNIRRARIQIDILSGTADSDGQTTVKTLREAINNGLVGIRQTIGTTRIGSATHEKDLDDFDGGAQSFRAITDITFEYSSTS